MARAALKHIVVRDGVAAYERENDDLLCALCDSKAVEDLELPVSPRPIPVCRRHRYRLASLTWFRRSLKVHLAPPKVGWLYAGPVMIWCERQDRRTLCGRESRDLRTTKDRAEVTCRTCQRTLDSVVRTSRRIGSGRVLG